MDSKELAVAAAEREGLRGRHASEPIALDASAREIGERVGDEGDARLQHVDVDATAAAAAFALIQGAEDAVGREHAGGIVRDRRAARLRMRGIDLQAEDPFSATATLS